jgi:hypothetical protein
VRELRIFGEISLKPGQKETVQFTLNTDDLAFYNARMQRMTEPGDFEDGWRPIQRHRARRSGSGSYTDLVWSAATCRRF